MSDFWNKPKSPAPPKPWEQVQPAYQEMVLDEQAMSEITGESPQNIFDEEEQDTLELMSDANLRLEQGRLYQMVLSNDIFGDTDADPKAIRNVQREIRKFVRERMEIMLGIRHEQAPQAQIVSSPFNDLEVSALKAIASRVSGGKTEEASQPSPASTPIQPKKDGITAISGNLRTNNAPTPVSKPVQKIENRPAPKTAPKAPIKSAIKEEGSALNKPIEDMTPEELAAYNKAAEERSARKRAALPTNMTPHPSAQQLEMMYTGMASNMAVKLVPANS